MRTEPALETASLVGMLTDLYDLGAVNLDFVPTGWVSACYRVTCANGEHKFLKLQPTWGPQAMAASSPAFYLPLTRRLHTSGLLPDIAYPLPTTTGQLWASWEGWRVILQNFIDGQVVGHAGMTDAVLIRLAGMVGRLHRSLPELDLQVRFFDHFEFPFQAQLVSTLAALHLVGPNDTRGQQGLRDLLLPRRDKVLNALRLLQGIHDRVKAASYPTVICHTDLHGENLMLDRENRLHIVDWEGAVLAPREHDLFTFAGEPRFRALFLPAYLAEAGAVDLNPDLITFYTLRRTLEDLADWVLRLVEGLQGDAQDASDLEEVTVTLGGLASFG